VMILLVSLALGVCLGSIGLLGGSMEHRQRAAGHGRSGGNG
jgi:hypothetical protein